MADVLIIAGEPSGEEHALSFLPRLQSLRSDLKFWGVGGDRLASMDVELMYHLRDFSSIGFTEVVAKIPFYRKALSQLVDESLKRGTRDAILIDFQDFNLRLAQRLAAHGIRVWYYVAPQAWAWRPWRATTLARTVHRLFTILPFEANWFASRGVQQLTPVPHPLVYNWQASLAKLPIRLWSERLLKAPRLMVLPGSRAGEVRQLMPIFMKTVQLLKEHVPGLHVTLSRVPHLNPDFFDGYADLIDQWITPDELSHHLLTSDAALAASGTVTLGTGLMGVPTIVAYQSSLANEFVVRQLIGYHRAISLTNLITEQMVFPEFLQQQVQPNLLARGLWSWWSDPVKWEETRLILAQLPAMLAEGEKDVGQLMAREMI